MMTMTKAELIDAAYNMTGGDITNLSLDQLHRLITVAQYVMDLTLNEIERRDELTFNPDDGRVIVPYMCDHMLDTILTRGPRDGAM